MTLENIYEDLKSKYPTNTILPFEELIFFQYEKGEDKIDFEIRNYNDIRATCDDTDYTGHLTELVKKYEHLPKHQIPFHTIDEFISNEFNTDYFDEAIQQQTGYKDYLYEELRRKVEKIDKEIILVSFGDSIKNPVAMTKSNISLTYPYKCEHTFNVKAFNIPEFKDLHRIRGTDQIMQRRTESGTGFDFGMECIVKYIEENDSKVIGIHCHAGHHRSVAVVELLKKNVYVNATVIHLHIKKK